MLSFVLFFAVATISSVFTLPQADPSTGIDELSLLINGTDCSFYTELNDLLQCGPKSHLMQYSYKYCQRLLNIRDTFENTEYQDTARECLQKKLFDQVKKIGQKSLTCDKLKKLDLDSHGSCLAVVSFKKLSANDIQLFLSVFQDTTVNYEQLCKLANSVAGYWSQIVKGDLMIFVKKQLKEIFTEGDTVKCSIKQKEIIEGMEGIIAVAEVIINLVKDIKDDIVVIVERAKSIIDDFTTIQQTIQGMKSGTISESDGADIIIEKTKSIVDSVNTIIKTINKILNPTPSLSGDGKSERIVNDVVSIIKNVQAIKSEVYTVTNNISDIIEIVNQIRKKKLDVSDVLEEIVNQVVKIALEHVTSITTKIASIGASAVDIVTAMLLDLDGIIGEGKAGEIFGGAIDGLGK